MFVHKWSLYISFMHLFVTQLPYMYIVFTQSAFNSVKEMAYSPSQV